ncbi:MAG: metal ABC transporter substrate-binding protein [Bacillota bacterium]
MKKLIVLMLMIAIPLTLSACTEEDAQDDRPVVMTTLFPQYDFAREIAGDAVRVEYLLPPGTSAHSYDPSPKDVTEIVDADLLIYTGDTMEPWVDSTILSSSMRGDLDVLDLSDHVELIEKDHDHAHDDHDDEHAHDDHDDEDAHDDEEVDEDADPHIWTDPLNAIKMVEAIESSLKDITDESHHDEISENADSYIQELEGYHEDVLHVLEHSEHDVIMHGGHNAFGYFIHRYDLEYVTPYEGFSTDSEPTPGAISDMVETMKEHGIDTLFSETLIDPRVADAISEETDAEILYLNTAGNVSKDALEDGVTYMDMMEENLETLKEGLNYNAED